MSAADDPRIVQALAEGRLMQFVRGEWRVVSQIDLKQWGCCSFRIMPKEQPAPQPIPAMTVEQQWVDKQAVSKGNAEQPDPVMEAAWKVWGPRAAMQFPEGTELFNAAVRAGVEVANAEWRDREMEQFSVITALQNTAESLRAENASVHETKVELLAEIRMLRERNGRLQTACRDSDAEMAKDIRDLRAKLAATEEKFTDCTDANRLLKALVDRADWQPISTPPKEEDGTAIHGKSYLLFASGTQCWLAQWNAAIVTATHWCRIHALPKGEEKPVEHRLVRTGEPIQSSDEVLTNAETNEWGAFDFSVFGQSLRPGYIVRRPL